MKTKKSVTDFERAVTKILKTLNGKSNSENKMILNKVNEVLEHSSILKSRIT